MAKKQMIKLCLTIFFCLFNFMTKVESLKIYYGAKVNIN